VSVLATYIVSLYTKARAQMLKRMLTIRATETELSFLARYAEQSGRTQSDLVRGFLRSLEKKLGPDKKATPVKTEKAKAGKR
jgi:hypothetical protein